MEIKDLQKTVHDTARLKGWWKLKELDYGNPSFELDLSDVNVGEKISLMHSELSEALEEYRNSTPPIYYGEGGKPEGIAVELADCIIRILDFAGAYGLDIEEALRVKIAYNATRSFRHGGKRC